MTEPSGLNLAYIDSPQDFTTSHDRMNILPSWKAEESHVGISAVQVDLDTKHLNEVPLAPVFQHMPSPNVNIITFAMNGSPGVRVVDAVRRQAVLDHAREQIFDSRGYSEYHISISVR